MVLPRVYLAVCAQYSLLSIICFYSLGTLAAGTMFMFDAERPDEGGLEESAWWRRSLEYLEGNSVEYYDYEDP